MLDKLFCFIRGHDYVSIGLMTFCDTDHVEVFICESCGKLENKKL